MSTPTVTTIIPAYRAARTIRRALDSVFAQTLAPSQILVVDDGSPDDLMAALTPYRGKITLIRKPNGGAASARNRGIDESTGDLIAFLDADDYWEPAKLEQQVHVMERCPEVGLTACRFYAEEPGLPRFEPFGIVEVPDARKFGIAQFDRVARPQGRQLLTFATRILTSAVLVRRDVLSGHRFRSGLEPAEDRDLWIRLILETPTYLSSTPLVTSVVVPGSLSRANINVDFSNMVKVIGLHSRHLGPRATRHWEAVFFRLWASCLLGGGLPDEAVGPAWNRLRRQPFAAEAWWILLKSAALARASRRRRADPLRPA